MLAAPPPEGMAKGEAASEKPVTGNGGGDSGPKGVADGPAAKGRYEPPPGEDRGLPLRSRAVCSTPNPKSLIYQAGGRGRRRTPSPAPPRKTREPWRRCRGGMSGGGVSGKGTL